MSNDEDYSLDKIKESHNFIDNSVFYKIYKEFDVPCKSIKYNSDASCPSNNLINPAFSEKVINLLKELYSNLYRVYFTSKNKTNYYFDDDYTTEVKKIGCICLKYWLYHQIVSKGLNESEIKDLFEGYTQYINGKIDNDNNYCNFNELSLNQINTFKNIYAFYAILYDNTNNIETCDSENCKYMNYFGKGLDDFFNSIKKCSIDPSNNNYCNQFNEFINKYMVGNEHAGISINYEPTMSTDNTPGKYLLSSEKYSNETLYIYLKDEKLLNFFKTSYFLSNKNTSTIAGTTVVGSAVGLSSIFYYLYKFTPFGKTLRKGKGENIVNIDEEEHNDLLYTEDTEQTPFKKRDYHIAYHTFSDT
ncbi:VIR protein [Plasmodium vivax]|uniref:VIR protein n=1 Tax=Plasmodium vivax TaxID=5855 RepID=A0A1G4ED22_PLAVI|nr:VIR protein [Plasmodium vivax]